jgi:hypothetical protein
MATYSEDALFKALLKNKPPQQPPKPAAPAPRKEVPRPVPPAQPVEAFQKQEQVIETIVTPPVKPLDLEPVIESINRLNSNINQMHGMIKTMIVPVLVLILVVAIGILLKAK